MSNAIKNSLSTSITSNINTSNGNILTSSKLAKPNSSLTNSVSNTGNIYQPNGNTNTTVSSLFLNQQHANIDFSALDEKEKKIIAEFVNLLEKSRLLFNGLRELPQYGHKNSQWQAYFGRTFDVYTKLWKFQQQHRQILDSKYEFKRWQIGEIASKIGQLYYHYYLRTSESNYLNESYQFYEAIQKRSYYSKANKEEKPDIMVKKLRYYARFIVVCLLLRKTKQVNELIKELSRQIDDYVKIFDPEDQLEWQLVKNEINDFIQADSVVNVVTNTISSTSNTNKTTTSTSNIIVSTRLNANEVPVIGHNLLSNDFYKSISVSVPSFTINNQLSLNEIIIVGNCLDQIKFSELSLDMFRMLQAVEREPCIVNESLESEKLSNITNNLGGAKSPSHLKSKDTTSNSTMQSILQRENPHKYLLYKPSFSQFYAYISSAFKDLPPHGVLMLYISADGFEAYSKNQLEHSYDFGGLRTNSKREETSSSSNKNTSYSSKSFDNIQNESFNRKAAHSKESHCIYPGDLYPFLRKPLLLVVDSTNSSAFYNFPNLFQQPFISLLSPTCLPVMFQDRRNQQGNILTLFLTNPLFGFCYVCNIDTLSEELYLKCQAHLKNIFIEIAKAFHQSKKLDSVFLKFSQDDFLRVFILRYVFCYISLRLHRGFKGDEYYPKCQPHLPDDIIENLNIQKHVLQLADLFNIGQLFLDPTNY